MPVFCQRLVTLKPVTLPLNEAPWREGREGGLFSSAHISLKVRGQKG